jgi:hypothetical protein
MIAKFQKTCEQLQFFSQNKEVVENSGILPTARIFFTGPKRATFDTSREYLRMSNFSLTGVAI